MPALCGRTRGKLTWLSMLPPSSSLSGAAPSEAPGWSRPAIPRRFARFSSRFARRISTCCSSRRRRSSSGLKALFALKVVRRCSGMYLSAMVMCRTADGVCEGGVWRGERVCLERGFIFGRGAGGVKRRKRQERFALIYIRDGVTSVLATSIRDSKQLSPWAHLNLQPLSPNATTCKFSDPLYRPRNRRRKKSMSAFRLPVTWIVLTAP